MARLLPRECARSTETQRNFKLLIRVDWLQVFMEYFKAQTFEHIAFLAFLAFLLVKYHKVRMN